jgi:hypothetical protein
MGKRGRPYLTDEQAAVEAVRIVDLAFRLRYRPSTLGTIGHTEASASLVISKRYRGAIGQHIGGAIRDLFPVENRIARAVQLVLDHEFSAYRASRMVGGPQGRRPPIDHRNLSRAVAAARKAAKQGIERVSLLRCEVSDANLVPSNTPVLK